MELNVMIKMHSFPSYGELAKYLHRVANSLDEGAATGTLQLPDQYLHISWSTQTIQSKD